MTSCPELQGVQHVHTELLPSLHLSQTTRNQKISACDTTPNCSSAALDGLSEQPSPGCHCIFATRTSSTMIQLLKNPVCASFCCTGRRSWDIFPPTSNILVRAEVHGGTNLTLPSVTIPIILETVNVHLLLDSREKKVGVFRACTSMPVKFALNSLQSGLQMPNNNNISTTFRY